MAGSAVAQPQTPRQVTDRAIAVVIVEQKARATTAGQRAALDQQFAGEVKAIDRLKQQKSSWRRDRQIADAKARSLETAKKLEKATRALAQHDRKIADAKKRALAAIDAELAIATTDAARKQRLVAARAEHAPRLAARAKKIVLPDGEIDPYADPEDLDQQAKAMRDVEAELAKQVTALDEQTARLRKAAELRKQHERAGELVVRDDGQPRRTTPPAGGRFAAGVAADTEDAGASPSPSPPPEGPPQSGDPAPEQGGFMADETANALADVIDPDTGDALRKAGRSSDPKARADATQRTRDAVAKKLEQLRKQRAAVEARARALRKP
jgi:hypothetical protein